MAPVQVLENLGPATLESYRKNKRKDILDYFPSEAYKERNELQTEIRICPSLVSCLTFTPSEMLRLAVPDQHH